MEEDEEINGKLVLTTRLSARIVIQYQDYRQDTRTVNKYMDEFDRLANRSDLEEIEDQGISKFVHGLQVSI